MIQNKFSKWETFKPHVTRYHEFTSKYQILITNFICYLSPDPTTNSEPPNPQFSWSFFLDNMKNVKKSLKIRIGIYIWWTRYYAVQELINVLPKLVRDCMLISASRYVKVHVHILYFYCSHPTTRIGTSFMEIFK